MIQRPAKRHSRRGRDEEDPETTVFDAVADFMSSHPAAAMEVGRRYLAEIDPAGAPMTMAEFQRELRRMDPEDAFEMGLKSADTFDRRNRLVVEADGGFATISDSEFSRQCGELANDEDFVTAVMCGQVAIPRQMAEVVGRYVDKRELYIDRRPRKAMASIGRRLSRLRPGGRRRRWRAPTAGRGNCPKGSSRATLRSAGRP
jgi:hypothetical protein